MNSSHAALLSCSSFFHGGLILRFPANQSQVRPASRWCRARRGALCKGGFQHQTRSSQSLGAGTIPSCRERFEHRVLNNKLLITREPGLEDAANLLLEVCVSFLPVPAVQLPAAPAAGGQSARPGQPPCCGWTGPGESWVRHGGGKLC